MIKPWINILIAAIFETGWTYALKYMNFSQLKNAYQADSLMSRSVGIELIPFLAYIIWRFNPAFDKLFKQKQAAPVLTDEVLDNEGTLFVEEQMKNYSN